MPIKLLVTGGSGFIGTNLIQDFATRGYVLANLDVKIPVIGSQAALFFRCDVLDVAGVNACFAQFQPDAVLHLAARADVYHDGAVEPFYAANTVGTKNILEAVKNTSSVRHVIVTSTQYVCRPGYTPTHLDDYNPHTVYGQSKVEAEKITKAANLKCAWTIIRPTNIWGPWNYVYRNSLIHALENNLYFHPTGPPAMQGFGYVKNFARQIDKLLHLGPDVATGKTLYIGDDLIPLYDWVNGFSRKIRGTNVRVIPRSLIYTMARFGDLFQVITKRQFVIFSARYRNMVNDYIVPMEPTFSLLGRPEISLQQGICETVAWSNTHPPK